MPRIPEKTGSAYTLKAVNAWATDQSIKFKEQGPSNNTQGVLIVVSLDTTAVIEVLLIIEYAWSSIGKGGI